MELNEGSRRIFGQHWRLILAFIVAGGLAGFAVHSGGAKLYSASARLTLDTQDPKTQPESTAISDTADAIATSPALVAKALADRVIQTRLDVTRGGTDQTIADLDRRITRLNQQISSLDGKVAALNVRAATTRDPLQANALRAKRDDASRTRDFLSEQRTVFETERTSVVSSNALLPEPTIISSATPPAHPSSSGPTADAVLGLLLGTILGIGVAALLETFRPRVVGGEAIARRFDTPLLGGLAMEQDGSPRLADMIRVVERLRLVASAENVRTICLLTAGEGIDVAGLSEELDVLAAADGTVERDYELVRAGLSGGQPRHAPAREERRSQLLRIRPFESRSFAMANGRGNGHGGGHASGVVLVCPPVLKQEAFVHATHLLRSNPGRLLGVIEYSRSRARREHVGGGDWESS